MTDFYIDLSAATNGTGTAVDPYNTFTGITFVSNARYWVRRTGDTPVYSGVINLGVLSNVEILGWPRVGEYGYYDRDASLTAWDADVHDYWTISGTSSTTVGFNLTSATNCFISRVQVKVNTSTGFTYIQLGKYCTLYKVNVVRTGYSGAMDYLKCYHQANKLINCTYTMASGTGTEYVNIQDTSASTGFSVYVIGYIVEHWVAGAVITPFANGLQSLTTTAGTIIDCRISGQNNVPINSHVYLFNVATHQYNGSVTKVIANLAATKELYLGGSDTSSTSNEQSSYIWASSAIIRITGDTGSNVGMVYILKTDTLNYGKFLRCLYKIHPLTQAVVTLGTDAYSTSTNLFREYSYGYIHKIDATLTLANIGTASAVTYKDSLNALTTSSLNGEVTSTTNTRDSGNPFSVGLENMATTLASVGAASPTVTSPLKTATPALETIKASVNPGINAVTLYGTDVTIGNPHLYKVRALYLKYCDSNGPAGTLVLDELQDGSSWQDVGTNSPFKYMYELESDDTVDVYLQYIKADAYAVSNMGFIDPKPVITNLGA